MNEKIVLDFDLFDGDFGSGEKTLDNKIVITKKSYLSACHICHGSIEKGEKSRVLTEVLDGHIGKYRVCNECCEAISRYEDDFEDTSLDDRYSLGNERRKEERKGL